MNYFTPRPPFPRGHSPVPPQVRGLDETSLNDDRARFKSVVLPHLDDAYGLARWLIGNPSDAEDVVQDACLRAFRGIRDFSNGNARAWVLTIVRRAAYGWLQKNRPAALVLVDDFESVEGPLLGELEVETPETVLIAKDEAALLTAAIAALPAPFRETLVLRDVHGLTYREIAEVTGVPMDTVMSRLARGRRELLLILATSDAQALSGVHDARLAAAARSASGIEYHDRDFEGLTYMPTPKLQKNQNAEVSHKTVSMANSAPPARGSAQPG